MKLKWNGLEIELTVDELKQMVEKGLISPEDDEIPYPEEWKDMIRQLPHVKPEQNHPPTPRPFDVVALYGCQIPSPIQCTDVPNWNVTTTLGTSAIHTELTSDTSAESPADKTPTCGEDSANEGTATNKE